jgi:hypothetical protein
MIFVASQKIHKVHKLGEMAEKTLAEIEDQEREEARGGSSPSSDEKSQAEAPPENETNPVTYEETFNSSDDLA